MNTLRELPLVQAQALVLGVMERHKEGTISPVALYKLTQEILQDGRASLVIQLIMHYPLPKFDTVDIDPEQQKLQDRLDAVRASLPGVYGPVHAVSYRMQQVLNQVEVEASPMVDYRAELGNKLDEYPTWRACLFHPDTSVRLAALTRIIETPNPIKEAAIVFLLGDQNAVVRQRAREALGVEDEDKRHLRYSNKDVKLRGKAQNAIFQIMECETDDELKGFFSDPRTSIRYAAALKLSENSPFWGVVVSDTSPRIRRIAAERASIKLTEVHEKLLQDENQTVRSAAGKRRLAQDIPIRTVPNPLIEQKAEWQERMK